MGQSLKNELPEEGPAPTYRKEESLSGQLRTQVHMSSFNRIPGYLPVHLVNADRAAGRAPTSLLPASEASHWSAEDASYRCGGLDFHSGWRRWGATLYSLSPTRPRLFFSRPRGLPPDILLRANSGCRVFQSFLSGRGTRTLRQEAMGLCGVVAWPCTQLLSALKWPTGL